MEAFLWSKLEETTSFFNAAVLSDDPNSFLLRWTELQEQLQTAIELGGLSSDIILAIEQLANRISIISTARADAAGCLQTTHGQAVQQCNQYWKTSPGAMFLSPKTLANPHIQPGPPVIGAANVSSFIAYRQFFLSHFTHPYPSAPQKAELLLTVPLQSATQLSTWFINARRRSGWQDLFKVYANSSRIELEVIMKKLEDGRGRDWEVDEECKAKVQSVKTWLSDGGRDRVEAGIQEVIRNGFKGILQ